MPAPSNAQRAFKGISADVWQWPQQLFDGTLTTFECVTRPDCANAIPFLDKNTILLTKQEQSGRAIFFDVPGGRLDARENPQSAAARELLEETGHRALRWLSWHEAKYNGMIRYQENIFLATDLVGGQIHHTDAGERIELMPTPWEDVVRMCLKRQLRQNSVMLAILQMEFNAESRDLFKAWLDETL